MFSRTSTNIFLLLIFSQSMTLLKGSISTSNATIVSNKYLPLNALSPGRMGSVSLVLSTIVSPLNRNRLQSIQIVLMCADDQFALKAIQAVDIYKPTILFTFIWVWRTIFDNPWRHGKHSGSRFFILLKEKRKLVRYFEKFENLEN